MKASKETLKEGDKIIFRFAEYHDDDLLEFDGTIYDVRDDGVDVLYLSGHRSRNDLVPYNQIIAKVDLDAPRIRLENAPFSGHFAVFEQ